jgi:hypothetical protein
MNAHLTAEEKELIARYRHLDAIDKMTLRDLLGVLEHTSRNDTLKPSLQLVSRRRPQPSGAN